MVHSLIRPTGTFSRREKEKGSVPSSESNILQSLLDGFEQHPGDVQAELGV